MTRPTKHPKTGVYRIRMRVPQDLRAALGTGERIVTLRTKDPKEAAAKAPAAVAKLKAEFNAARAASGPARRLSGSPRKAEQPAPITSTGALAEERPPKLSL